MQPTSPAPGITRRRVLFTATAATALLITPARVRAAPTKDPFTLGLAAGDPTPSGAVLWTRLAPEPFEPDGGMPARPVEVAWRVFAGERSGRGRRVVAEGIQLASPELAHSVHVELDGLEPRREYFYEFQYGRYRTRLGRFKTAPPVGAPMSELSFAMVSCQSWRAGYNTSYRDMLDADHDLVVHLGDYIYEIPYHFGARAEAAPEITWLKPQDLSGYRYRYALHKSDPDLQRAHERFAFTATWDDHEVENDWGGDYRRNGGSGPAWKALKSAAFQAYYEHMPLRRPPHGGQLQIFRRVEYGDLATFHVLDTRQFRSKRTTCANESRDDGYCATAWDDQRTILGDDQEQWLHSGLRSSAGRWNILANQVGFSPFITSLPDGGKDFVRGGTNWTGYAADLQSLQSLFASGAVTNPVVITGDQHVSRVFDVPASATDLTSRAVATEFVGTSVTSGGTQQNPLEEFDDAINPHSRWFCNDRGYVAVRVSPDAFLTEFRSATDIDRADGPVISRRTWAVENGRPGVQSA